MWFDTCIILSQTFSFVFSWSSYLFEKLYQTLALVFDHISKCLKLSPRLDCASFFNFHSLSVWKCDETLVWVYDVIYHSHQCLIMFPNIENRSSNKSLRCLETWSNTSVSVWYNFSNKFVLQEKTKEKVWLIYASVWSRFQTCHACDFPLS